MNIFNKLPLAGSALAFVCSIVFPFILNTENTQIVQVSKEPVVAKSFRRKAKPKLPWQKFQEANKYLNCIEDSKKTKEECRRDFWFWDV